MRVSIQFFGAAAYQIVTASGRHVLIDPFRGDPSLMKIVLHP